MRDLLRRQSNVAQVEVSTSTALAVTVYLLLVQEGISLQGPLQDACGFH